MVLVLVLVLLVLVLLVLVLLVLVLVLVLVLLLLLLSSTAPTHTTSFEASKVPDAAQNRDDKDEEEEEDEESSSPMRIEPSPGEPPTVGMPWRPSSARAQSTRPTRSPSSDPTLSG